MLGIIEGPRHDAPLLPKETQRLMMALFGELVLFAFVFFVACSSSRVTADNLLLKRSHGVRSIFLGLGYSIALRILIFAVMFCAALLIAFYLNITGTAELEQATMKKFVPRIDQIVDAEALVENPAYFWINLTLVSFLVAALREELWRAGMLAAMTALFPRQTGKISGQVLAVSVAALIFGLGHLTQGWGGVALTTVLGLGLGAIMMLHRSVWAAVWAHGFFNATSFLMLYWLARFRPDWLPMS